MNSLCLSPEALIASPDVDCIVIEPRVGPNHASVTLIVGADSDGDWTTVYNGGNESALIYALRDLREANPDAVVVWRGWEGWTVRAFQNHPASVLCLRVETDVVLSCGMPSRHIVTAIH